jgi:hypothetical protein
MFVRNVGLIQFLSHCSEKLNSNDSFKFARILQCPPTHDVYGRLKLTALYREGSSLDENIVGYSLGRPNSQVFLIRKNTQGPTQACTYLGRTSETVGRGEKRISCTRVSEVKTWKVMKCREPTVCSCRRSKSSVWARSM